MAHWDESVFVEDEMTIVVQIRGKVRAKLQVSSSATKEEVLEVAKAHEQVQKWLEGKEIRKEIYVPKKLVNFVV